MKKTNHKKNQIGIFALLGLCMGSLGVVYGVISLVGWVLTLIITLKYITFVLRADSDGEGGVFSLLSILRQSKVKRVVITGILILAAGLLFGEGIITPSISVLSAIEGLKVINPAFEKFVVPLTIIILTLLFAFQSKGTGKIGRVFGPIMIVWFLIIGILGSWQIFWHPQILYALNPLEGIRFILSIGAFKTMAVLGSVVLVITGGRHFLQTSGILGAALYNLVGFF